MLFHVPGTIPLFPNLHDWEILVLFFLYTFEQLSWLFSDKTFANLMF